MHNTTTDTRWYPKAEPAAQPSPWWYFGRAVYVSRRDYLKIFLVFVSVGVPLGAIGLLGGIPLFLTAAWCLAGLGLAMLAYSLFGLYRMYGSPSRRYMEDLLALGQVSGSLTIADLHVGTYRHAYALADALPEATIHTVDCLPQDGPPTEAAVLDVRALEPAPEHPQIRPQRADRGVLPLSNRSCDVVVLGFGTHEIPRGEKRTLLFEEACRVLKSKGTLLLFEHGIDLKNYLIFGPVIFHVTPRAEWQADLDHYFEHVEYRRSRQAVDLFAARERRVSC